MAILINHIHLKGIGKIRIHLGQTYLKEFDYNGGNMWPQLGVYW